MFKSEFTKPHDSTKRLESKLDFVRNVSLKNLVSDAYEQGVADALEFAERKCVKPPEKDLVDFDTPLKRLARVVVAASSLANTAASLIKYKLLVVYPVQDRKLYKDLQPKISDLLAALDHMEFMGD